MPARIQLAFRLIIASNKEALFVSLKADVPHKGKADSLHAKQAQRDDRARALPIPDPDARRGSTPQPLPLYTRYPLYRRLGVRRGRSGRQRKISPPSASEPSSPWPVTIPKTPIWPPTSLMAERKHEGTKLPDKMRNKHFTNPVPSPAHKYSTKIYCIIVSISEITVNVNKTKSELLFPRQSYCKSCTQSGQIQQFNSPVNHSHVDLSLK